MSGAEGQRSAAAAAAAADPVVVPSAPTDYDVDGAVLKVSDLLLLLLLTLLLYLLPQQTMMWMEWCSRSTSCHCRRQQERTEQGTQGRQQQQQQQKMHTSFMSIQMDVLQQDMISCHRNARNLLWLQNLPLLIGVLQVGCCVEVSCQAGHNAHLGHRLECGALRSGEYGMVL
jgi:hypothetical protein